jgi:hypothetical protein
MGEYIMKIVKRAIAIGIINTVLISCGVPSKGAGSFRTPVLTKNPIWLTGQDTVCASTFSTSDEKNIYIARFLKGIIEWETINFKHQIYRNYVMASQIEAPISRTIYGEKTLREVTVHNFNPSSGDYRSLDRKSEKIVSAGSNLTLCPGTNLYDRLTYESATLNISNSITKTYNLVQKVLPETELAALTVSVAPENKTLLKFQGGARHLSQEIRYSTDNAYYSSSEQKIVFLPQSEENFKLTKSDIAFWEVPMVASHEYGHHLFYSLFTKNLGPVFSALLNDHTNCFETKIKYSKASNFAAAKSNVKSSRNNSASFATSAINEGFSDLIAFYSLDEKETSFKGVPCFTKNREVSSNRFMDGTLKEFGKDAQEKIKDEYSQESDRDCKTPDFQQIHQVGALFAFQANRLLNKSLSNKEEKLKVILNWAKSLAKQHDELAKLNAIDYLYHSLELVHLEALKEKSLPNQTSCEVMNSVFTENMSSFTCKYLK